MDIFSKTLLLLISLIQFSAATFFPFTSFRPPIYQTPRYGYRPPRPPSNYVPVQSPILDVRVFVPRALYDLFNMRPPGPESNYPRPYAPPFRPPYYPPNPHPYYPENHPNQFPPNDYPPNQFPPNQFPPNRFPPNQSPPNDFPPPRGYPPINSDTFINLMREFYPNLIYRMDPRYPNIFAVRLPSEPLPPPTHLPDSPLLPNYQQDPESLTQQQPPLTQQQQQQQQQQQLPQQQEQQPNQFINRQLSSNVNRYLEPSRNFPPSFNKSPQNQLIIIRAQ